MKPSTDGSKIEGDGRSRHLPPNGVLDNAARSRFELHEGGAMVWADYRRCDGVLIIPHVEAAARLRGTGAAARLMEGLLHAARAEALKVAPICAYAAAYMQRHPAWDDLRA